MIWNPSLEDRDAFHKRSTTRTRNATKHRASLIDELQGMDLQSLLTQIENVQTNHLIVPQHQQEVNTKKELGP